MCQHQVRWASQEKGREAVDVFWCIAGYPHIGEAQACKIGPEALSTRGPLLPAHRIGRIRDTTDLDAVAPLSVLVEGTPSEDFGIIRVSQNCHHARHACAS